MNIKNKIKNKINNKGAKMKHLILSLMVFGGFQALSINCDISNYKEFIYNKKATDKLIKKTGKGCYLKKADLSGAHLSKANLQYADLEDANLTKADLTKADLEDANLTKADLTKADLEDANLNGANLSKAFLSGANLNWADLRKANLAEANLLNAYLYEANLTGASLIKVLFPSRHKKKLSKEQQKQVESFIEATNCSY